MNHFLSPTLTHRPKRLARLFPMRLLIVFALLSGIVPAWASTKLDFDVVRLGNGENAVLIIGGIQGDEPGGFSAATLLATRYEIKKGAIHVVPNLNFPSIIKRSRGIHGDMNRKFASLDNNDPEYATVRRIQELINQPEVGLILNLHDGSGYYRPQYIDKLRNPARWGQSIIIDQDNLQDGAFMREIGACAQIVATAVNQALLDEIHAVHVHNTHTADGDREMEKSLSYYAARQNKAAFGLEASKEFSVAFRAYYHLAMIEEFLKLAGIEFTRDFPLTIAGIEKALSEYLGVSFASNRIFLPLENVRSDINFLPLPKESNIITSKPIMAVLPCEKKIGKLCIHYGNRTLAAIEPEWFEINEELDAMPVTIDGVDRMAGFGQIINVREKAVIKPVSGFRVNAIGFESGASDESGKTITRKNLNSSYSIDKAATIYRVEVYKGKSFAGMFLLRFSKNPKAPPASNLPVTAGKESSLGY